MERIWSRIVEEIVSTVLTLIYRISCVFLFVPRAALSLAQRLYISCFGRNLKNKVVLITGATSAIGRSLAHDLFRLDCRLILCARNDHDLEQLKSELISAARPTGRTTTVTLPVTIPMDVFEPSSIGPKCSEIVGVYGRVDAVISNASVFPRGQASNIEMKTFRKIMEINFFGSVAVVKSLLPFLQESRGQIVFVSSSLGKMSLPECSGFAASQHAINAFADALRAEVADEGIGVTVASIASIANNTISLEKCSASPPNRNGTESKMNRPAKLAARKIREALQLGTREIMVTKSLYHDALITLRHLAPSAFFKITELLAREGGRQKAM